MTIVAHYEVLEKIGEGGMAAVYKARDTRLDRLVALKVLPPDAAANRDRRRRLLREARAASSLDHPNIVHIYDVNHSEGVDFIAMEYVRGRTLDQAIGGHGLPWQEALEYARQIAAALEAAHAAGIAHRDLKPGNIMITSTGLVKVLDFGLAKSIEPMEPRPADPDLTVTVKPCTEEGVILGTVAYMSPEQAEGKHVDGRSDIFSFGSVLYEMVTGRRAFQGDSNVAVLSAILSRDPAPAGTPLGPVIARCLRKDPRQRFQSMEEVRATLAPAPARPRRHLVALAAMLVLLAGIAILTRRLGRESAPTGPVLKQLTWDSGLTTDPALSLDGRLLAYASDRGGKGNLEIWVQRMAGGDPVQRTFGEADNHEPAFSADGATIAFRSEQGGGGIYVVPTLGGEPRLIAPQGHRPRFSPDGSQIAYFIGGGLYSSIYVVAAAGGAPRQLAADFAFANNPTWSPDGKHILFWGVRDRSAPPPQSLDWWIAPLDGRPPLGTGALALFRARGMLDPSVPGEWVSDRVIFSARLGDSTNLWQTPLSTRTLQVSGEPRRLTFGAALEGEPSMAAGGLLAFANLASRVGIWGLAGGRLEPLTQDAALNRLPTVSTDGRRIAFLSNRAGANQVWVKDSKTGKESAVATSGEPLSPVISQDGARIAYGVLESGKRPIYIAATAGGAAKKVCDDCGGPTGWSADGSRILYQYMLNQPRSTLGLLDVVSGARGELLKHSRYNLYRGHFSPDGRWIALHANSAGGTRLFLVPFDNGHPPPEDQWIAVTDGKAFDDAARWSPDGRMLYFVWDRDGFRCLWAQRLDPASGQPRGAPFAVEHFHSARRSLAGVPLNSLDLCVARDRIVFNLRELTGNIWMARTP